MRIIIIEVLIFYEGKYDTAYVANHNIISLIIPIYHCGLVDTKAVGSGSSSVEGLTLFLLKL